MLLERERRGVLLGVRLLLEEASFLSATHWQKREYRFEKMFESFRESLLEPDVLSRGDRESDRRPRSQHECEPCRLQLPPVLLLLLLLLTPPLLLVLQGTRTTFELTSLACRTLVQCSSPAIEDDGMVYRKKVCVCGWWWWWLQIHSFQLKNAQSFPRFWLAACSEMLLGLLNSPACCL